MKMRYAGEPKESYFRVSHRITEIEAFKNLKPADQVLYFTLCRLRNRLGRNGNGGTFVRSDRYLSQDSGLSRSAVGRAKRSLKEKGFIDYSTYKRGNRCRFHIWEGEDWDLTQGKALEGWHWEDHEEELDW